MYNVAVEWLDEEKSSARFALPGRQQWTAQHVSDLIRILAEIRAEMMPAVSEAPPPVHEPLHDPLYATELHPFSGGTLLELRHPSLGWLEFVLPSVERKRIASSLAEQESAWQSYGRL